MSAVFELDAELRNDTGKGASRRLRRVNNKVPAIVYGGGEAPTSIMLEHNKVLQAIEHEAFYSHILTLNVGKKKQKVVLKDLHRHHFKRAVMHMDFQRVKDTDKITMRIPLHFVGQDTCPGVKAGGLVSHLAIDVEMRCMAKDLPEFIEVNISELGMDQSIHLSDIKKTLKEGMELLALSHGNDMAVVNIHAAKAAAAEEEAPADAAAEGDDKAKAEEGKSDAKGK